MNITGQVQPFPGSALVPVPVVPRDPIAVAMFTAHRIDDTRRSLAHATERMAAARKATGVTKGYHVGHVRNHLTQAINNGHQLVQSVRANYPREAAELDALNKIIGMAKAAYPQAGINSFAHLVETILYHEAHGKRHADALATAPAGAGWDFDADHVERHLEGALEHVGKLEELIRDNYPAEAKWLAGLSKIENSVTEQATELAFRFNPAEHRNARGEWSRVGSPEADALHSRQAEGENGVRGTYDRSGVIFPPGGGDPHMVSRVKAAGTHEDTWRAIGTEHNGTVTPHDSLGIRRGDMPQLTGPDAHGKVQDYRAAFEADLKARGIPVTRETVNPADFKPSQNELNKAKVERQARAIEVRDPSALDAISARRPAMVSADNRILDNHHKWAALMLAGDHPMHVLRIGLPAREALAEAAAFAKAHDMPARDITVDEMAPKPARRLTPTEATAAHAGTTLMGMGPDGFAAALNASALLSRQADHLELAATPDHRHIPGTDYNWKHTWIPLTAQAARSHFRGKIPATWSPSRGTITGQAEAPARETIMDKRLERPAGHMGVWSAGKVESVTRRHTPGGLTHVTLKVSGTPWKYIHSGRRDEIPNKGDTVTVDGMPMQMTGAYRTNIGGARVKVIEPAAKPAAPSSRQVAAQRLTEQAGPGTAASQATARPDRGDAWLKLGNFQDSTDHQTGEKTSSLSATADFGTTIHEEHRSGTPWNSGKKQYTWQVSRQRTEREGPDERGQHWESGLGEGKADTMAQAKRDALAQVKAARLQHVLAGGDVGYGDAATGAQIRAYYAAHPDRMPEGSELVTSSGEHQGVAYRQVIARPKGVIGGVRTLHMQLGEHSQSSMDTGHPEMQAAEFKARVDAIPAKAAAAEQRQQDAIMQAAHEQLARDRARQARNPLSFTEAVDAWESAHGRKMPPSVYNRIAQSGVTAAEHDSGWYQDALARKTGGKGQPHGAPLPAKTESGRPAQPVSTPAERRADASTSITAQERQEVHDRAAAEREAGQRNAQAMSRQQAQAQAQRTFVSQSLGVTANEYAPAQFPRQTNWDAISAAHRDMMAGHYAKANAGMKAEAARLRQAGNTRAAAQVERAVAKVEKAQEHARLIPPPLAMIGRNGKDDLQVLDHKGREYRVAFDEPTLTVTVSHNGRTETKAVASRAQATAAASELAGKINGRSRAR